MKHIIAILLSIFMKGLHADSKSEDNQYLEAAFHSCHFKMQDKLNGKFILTNSDDRNIIYHAKTKNPNRDMDVEISISCEPGEWKKVFAQSLLEKENETWFYNTALLPEFPVTGQVGEIPIIKEKAQSLDGANKFGAATTYDQDEDESDGTRSKILNFCLSNSRQTICGASSRVALVAAPKTSVLPEVLEMLKSIEFLDPVEGAFTRP